MLAKKIEMSEVFDEEGNVIPVTVLKASEVDGEALFQENETVQVSGRSKGKGFQGVVKRHGFHGGPRTHGQKHSEREPGSIGATWPERVLKGKKMPGRMGGKRVTVKNLTIVKVLPEKNILYVKGAVPGARGTLVEIRGWEDHGS